jgi:hypothetical protein
MASAALATAQLDASKAICANLRIRSSTAFGRIIVARRRCGKRRINN